ncbi:MULTISPECIES: FAD-dependent oxidoreductase [Rhizobium]|uniref:FAD-dependent oxidoreductase n=1 Tax=Rhizobium phaseoli TaxID=396 RepID=UPI0002EB8B02|nr:FAD-dependent oxidoreductase [Rhizobium phaseoli]
MSGLMLSLSLAITNQCGGGGSTVLPTFAYQTETETLASAFTAAPTRRRKRTMDWAIKTLKDQGVWTKLKCFYKVGNDQQSSLINWKTPGTNNLTVVGSPGFTANNQWTPAANARLMTGVLLSDLDNASCGIFVLTKTNTDGTSTSDCGALTAAGNGLTMCCKNSSNVMQGRCGSANVTTLGASGDWDGFSFHMLNRVNSTNIQAFRGPVKKADVAAASAAMGAVEIPFLALNNNGTFTTGIRAHSCFGILQAGVTEAEAKVLANVCRALDDDFQYGELDTYDAGVQPQSVSTDVVIYGATSLAGAALYEAKRLGLNVVIVGGWRDRFLGGMSAAGLGHTDFDNKAGLGGLPRWIMAQMQTIQGTTSTNFSFQPRYFGRVLAGMLDPRITNGLDAPVYWSNGVASVQKTGARITSITTVDGRTFSARYFVDASYEGDLMKMAGISTRLGREANAEFSETLNGYRGILSDFGGANHQYKNAAGTLVNIDPYVTPGVSASGLLPNVKATYTGSPANGAADSNLQSYNFRITATTNKAYLVPFPSTPPSGFDAANYEALLRLLAADATISMDDIFLYDAINTAGDIFDLNAKGGFSTDPFGLSWTYPAASYSARETLWKAHANHIYGMMYVLQYYNDARVPAALRTEALNHGLHALHYTKPRLDKGDDFQWMPQLYVRESYRMDNDFMLRQSDISHTDGTTPRSIKTISTISYAMDSHSTQALADPNSGTPRIWNEGNWEADRGGVDLITPVPYEVITPRKTECENLLVLFGIAATHVGFGPFRMEFTAMQAAQSSMHFLKIAMNNSDQAVQDVDYPTARTSILASNTLSGETQPVLPQVN